MAQRYYWLKIEKDFAKDKRVKKLKKIPGGLNFAFIYLEMLLSSVDEEGLIMYEGIEDSVAKEIALELDEDPDDVQITISYLMSVGLMTDLGDGKFLLPYVVEHLGSEGASAKRVRKFRDRQKALQCNTNVTDMKRQALQCNTDVTQVKQNCNVEKRREEKENILKDKESFNKSDKPTLSLKKKRAPFKKPSIEQLKEYIQSKSYSIDPEEFFNYYESVGWVCGKVPMKNWKNAVIAWEKHQERWGTKKKKDKNSFQQNEYDFEALERELRAN